MTSTRLKLAGKKRMFMKKTILLLFFAQANLYLECVITVYSFSHLQLFTIFPPYRLKLCLVNI